MSGITRRAISRDYGDCRPRSHDDGLEKEWVVSCLLNLKLVMGAGNGVLRKCAMDGIYRRGPLACLAETLEQTKRSGACVHHIKLSR